MAPGTVIPVMCNSGNGLQHLKVHPKQPPGSLGPGYRV